jgi:hypothetical protein
LLFAGNAMLDFVCMPEMSPQMTLGVYLPFAMGAQGGELSRSLVSYPN